MKSREGQLVVVRVPQVDSWSLGVLLKHNTLGVSVNSTILVEKEHRRVMKEPRRVIKEQRRVKKERASGVEGVR